MPSQIWEVVGGTAETGGIIVRSGLEISSSKVDRRLSTGALVKQLSLQEGRLHYARLTGTGPDTGWVSIKLNGKDLLVKSEKKVDSIMSNVSDDDRDDGAPSKAVRIWAISDIHTEQAGNLKWIQELSLSKYQNDVLLLAGDVAPNLKRLEETFTLLVNRFARVFFVPGNHDLWVSRAKDAEDTDSLQKLQAVLELCVQLGVETQPAVVETNGGRGVLVVPLFSWYHSSFDTEPDLEGWDGVQPVTFLSDFTLTKWPAPLSMEDKSVAEQLDKHNDSFFPCKIMKDGSAITSFDCLCGLPRDSFSAVISFSHFLPRKELFPERRFSNFPNLMKGIGSDILGERVRLLKPDCHIFGHTHYGWDTEIEGVRYIQAALGNVGERKMDFLRFAVGDFLAIDKDPEPFLVFDSSGIPPRRRAPFSTMYDFVARKPNMTSTIASWAQGKMTPTPGGPGRIGLGGQAPPWVFGPEKSKSVWVETFLPKMSQNLKDKSIPYISVKDLRAALDASSDNLPDSPLAPVLLDARPYDAMKSAYLRGAIAAADPARLALDDELSNLASLWAKFNDDKRLKVVYTSAEFSEADEKVARALAGLAFCPDFSGWRLLKGGFEAWIAMGGPVSSSTK